jgi:hypothetical protein
VLWRESIYELLGDDDSHTNTAIFTVTPAITTKNSYGMGRRYTFVKYGRFDVAISNTALITTHGVDMVLLG